MKGYIKLKQEGDYQFSLLIGHIVFRAWYVKFDVVSKGYNKLKQEGDYQFSLLIGHIVFRAWYVKFDVVSKYMERNKLIQGINPLWSFTFSIDTFWIISHVCCLRVILNVSFSVRLIIIVNRYHLT